MNNEQFDRILHSKLADYQVVPPPEVWEGIEKRNPKRKAVIWWMSVFVLLFIAAGAYFLIPENKTEPDRLAVKEQAEAKKTLIHAVSSNPVAAHPKVFKGETNSVPNTHFTSTTQTAQPSNAVHSPAANTADLSSAINSTSMEVLFPVSLLWLSQLPFSAPSQAAASYFAGPESLQPHGNPISFVVTAGPLFASKHLKSKYNYPGDEKYIRYRNESEMRNSAWSASAFIQMDLSNHFFVRTGINYTSISENIGLRYLKAQVDGVTTDTIVGTRNEITDAMQLFSVSENHDFNLLADYTLRDQAEYRFLSFPVLAGLKMDWSKFSFYASAGLALNFSSAYAGKILAPDSAYLFSIKNGPNSPFSKLVGFTLIGSAGVGFSVSDKVKLLFEPSCFKQIPDITKPDYRLSQRFRGYGLQAGVIYKL